MPYKDKQKQKEKNREYQAKHYQLKKQYYIDKAKIGREKLRDIVSKLKNDLRCEFCGEDHIACLDFHHRDPSEKDFNISTAVVNGYGINRIMQEIAKCSILCANCHRKLHYKEKDGGVV